MRIYMWGSELGGENMDKKYDSVACVKRIISDLTRESLNDIERDDFDSFRKKIRAIERLIYSIALIEESIQ